MTDNKFSKQVIFFDLDGTITDPKIGITKSVKHALNAYGIQVDDLDSLCPFIGPPLYESFMSFYGFSAEKAREAIEKYREYFRDTCIYENVPYDGIEQLLQRLVDEGKQLAIATSKPTVFAVRIAEHFGLTSYFKCIIGSELDGTRTRKGEVIAQALKDLDVKDLETVIMIGDREHDIIGARETGIDSIGVLYGYGNREELERAGATAIAASVTELGYLLLRDKVHSEENTHRGDIRQ